MKTVQKKFEALKFFVDLNFDQIINVITNLTFMMVVTASSLPKTILLRRVLKPKLLEAFFAIVALVKLIVFFTLD